MMRQDSAVLAQGISPDVVVQDYLDFMLQAVTETEAERELELEAHAPVQAEVPAHNEIQRPVNGPTHAPVQQEENCSLASPSPRANGRPLWAQGTFECLLFDVQGLKLAAALVELGGIARIEDNLSPLFGQSDWFLGLLHWNGRNIRVIDTARLIMPERVGEQVPDYQLVLLIEGSDWGLAVDSASEAMHLTSDEVRWRSNARTRPWLAGTVLDKMCALLDVSNITRMLQAENQGSDVSANELNDLIRNSGVKTQP